MKYKPSNHCHQHRCEYAIYSSRLSVVGVRWQQSVSNNASSVKQSDNGERRTRWLAACDTLWAADTGLDCASGSSEMREKTLKRWFLASAGFFYKTPITSMTGIVKMVRRHFSAALSTIATLTQSGPSAKQVVETHSLCGGDRLLKILVSAVRFCPGPPPNPQALPPCGAFYLVLGISTSVAAQYLRCPQTHSTIQTGGVLWKTRLI